MKRIIGSAALAISLVTFSPAYAGDLFEDGLDAAMKGDYKTAFKIWKPLGMQGDGNALFELALMYHSGLHVEQNEAIAVQLYQMAAEKGHPMAQQYLAAGYQNGWFGLPINESLAAYWLGKAESAQRGIAQGTRNNTIAKGEIYAASRNAKSKQ
jgi:TPR repeat protein